MKKTIEVVNPKTGERRKQPFNIKPLWSAASLSTGDKQVNFFTKEESGETMRNYLSETNPFPNGQGRIVAMRFGLYNASWADMDLTSAALHTALNAVRNTAEVKFYHGEDVLQEALLGELIPPQPHQITVAPVEAGTASNAYGANATALADRQESPMSLSQYMMSFHSDPLEVESNLSIKTVVEFQKVAVPAALNNHILVCQLFTESWHKS